MVVTSGGIAIVIDYGHQSSSVGDTLQAVRSHRFAPVLEQPGEQDLTAHVDFEAVARDALSEGALVTPVVRQGEWLLRLGIEARAQALVSANPARSEEIKAAFDRLTGSNGMGDLFKVVAIHEPGTGPPAGFT
jgi:NADH dehydrogenase [ubiquinone] 1 alpha subcomplex assembly factor 7